MLQTFSPRPCLAAQEVSRIAIVASRYNEKFVEVRVAHAVEEMNAIDPRIQTEIFHVPGAFEIPFLTRQIIERRKPDAVICLGVLLRGETAHADLIAASVSDTLCRLSVEISTPIIHAVLLLNNEEQADERCLGKELNRGIEAARAAIEVLRDSRNIMTQ